MSIFERNTLFELECVNFKGAVMKNLSIGFVVYSAIILSFGFHAIGMIKKKFVKYEDTISQKIGKIQARAIQTLKEKSTLPSSFTKTESTALDSSNSIFSPTVPGKRGTYNMFSSSTDTFERLKHKREIEEEQQEIYKEVSQSFNNLYDFTKWFSCMVTNLTLNFIGDNKIKREDDFDYIGWRISELFRLKKLEINFNNNCIKHCNFEKFLECLSCLFELQELSLNLGFNDIEDDQAEIIANGLSKLTKLKKLNLNFYYNNIEEVGAEILGYCIGNLSQLHTLKICLWGNKIEDDGICKLISGLSSLQQLKEFSLEFSLSKNEININQLVEKIVSTFKKLKKLSLMLSNPNGGEPIMRIFEQEIL
jgi:hypothetical protein